MNFRRTRTAIKRFFWGLRGVRAGWGDVELPPKLLNPGEKTRTARRDLLGGHSLVNIGSEFGREMFGVEKKEHVWTIWFSMGACICLVLYLT